MLLLAPSAQEGLTNAPMAGDLQPSLFPCCGRWLMNHHIKQVLHACLCYPQSTKGSHAPVVSVPGLLVCPTSSYSCTYTVNTHTLQLHFHPFINFLFSCYTRYLSIHIFYYRNSSLFTTSGLTLLIMTHLCVFLYVNLKPRPVSDFPFPLFPTNHAHSKFLSNHTTIV